MTRGSVYAGKAVIVIDAIDKVDQVFKGVENRAKKLANTVGAMGRTALGGGFFAGLGQATLLGRFAKFDDLMLELRVKMGMLGRVTEQQEQTFARLEKRIRSLGKTTSYTTQEVAEGAIRLAQAGFSGQEIEDSLQAVLDLARGTSTDLENAARVLANTVRTFHLETATANEVVSQFVKASRLGTVEIDDLAEGLKYSSSTAVELGQSLSTVLAVFTLLSERGMRGSIAGTSFNTAMSQITKKMSDLEQQFAGVGFKIQTTADGSLDLVGTFRELDKATKGFSKLERVSIFQDIFNLRGARAAAPLVNGDVLAELASLSQNIAAAGNEARLAAEVMDSGFGGAIRRATSALEDFNITLGKLQSGPLVSLLGAVPPLINLFDELAKKNQGLVLGLASLPAVALAGGAAMLTLSFALRRVAGLVGALRGIGGIAAKFGGMGLGAQAMKGLGKAKMPAIAAGLGQFPTGAASPTGINNRGLPKAVAAQRAKYMRDIAFRTQGMNTSASQAANQLQIYKRNRHFAKMGGPFAAQHVQRAAAAKQAFKVANANKVAQRVAIGGIQNKIAALPQVGRVGGGANVLGQVLSGIGKAGKGAKGILSVAAAFGKFSLSIAKLATNANVIMGVLQVILLFGDRIPGVRTVLASLGNAFSAVFGQIASIPSALGPAFDYLKQAFGLLGDKTTQGLGFQGITESLSLMGDIVTGKLQAAWGAFKQQLGGVWDMTKLILGTMWELLKVVFEIASNSIGNVIGNAADAMTQRFQQIFRFAQNSEGSFADTFKSILVGAANIVAQLFDWVGYAIIKFNNVFYDFTEQIEAALLRVIDMIPGINTMLPQAEVAKRRADRQLREEQDLQANKGAMAGFQQKLDQLFGSDAFKEGSAALQQGLQKAQSAAAMAGQRMALMQQYASMQYQINAQRNQLQTSNQQQLNPAIQRMDQIQEVKQVIRGFAAALVGSAAGTRGNVLRPVTESELKKQTSLLEDIKGELETSNDRSGNVFRL